MDTHIGPERRRTSFCHSSSLSFLVPVVPAVRHPRRSCDRHHPGKTPLPPCEQRLAAAAQGLHGVPIGFVCVVSWVGDVVIKKEPKNEEKHLVSLKERSQLKKTYPRAQTMSVRHLGLLFCACWLVWLWVLTEWWCGVEKERADERGKEGGRKNVYAHC